MLKWVRKHQWLVTFTAVIAILIFSFFVSLFIPFGRDICEAAKDNQKPNCEQYHLGPFALMAVFKIIDEHNGFFTATATLVMAVFTGTLWFVTNKSVELAKEEFIAAHYPRIILREVDFIDGQIHYMLANTGSEAELVESWITVEPISATSPMPRNLRSFGHNQLGPLKFPHGGTHDLKFNPKGAGFFFHFPDARRIATETTEPIEKIYFVGALRYRDGSGNLRRSVFRRRWNFELSRFERTDNPDHEYAD